MKPTINFKKIYKRLTKEDIGYETNAIVTFQKEGILFTIRTLDDDEARLKSYRVENVVSRYGYRLFIDLWLITFYFRWNKDV